MWITFCPHTESDTCSLLMWDTTGACQQLKLVIGLGQIWLMATCSSTGLAQWPLSSAYFHSVVLLFRYSIGDQIGG
jgi:hypothetical protein